MTSKEGHVPVLRTEALKALNIMPNGIYLDATGGLGGHAAGILQQLGEGGRLIICDWDERAVSLLEKRFANEGRVRIFHTHYSTLFDNLDFFFHGILADLGISSEQLADENLGIGFELTDAPLDMRVAGNAARNAAQILKQDSEGELADIFYHYGGETAARKLAAAIVTDRRQGIDYKTTTELRLLCERVLGRYYRTRKIHPATKIFQALRIAINNELTELKDFLERAPQRLHGGGHLVVISFHVGEDRLVKQKFRELAQTKKFLLPQRKPIVPERAEILNNPRARSAKMRVVERI